MSIRGWGMGVYVIGINKEWVEFRLAQERPKTLRSECSRTIRVPSGWPDSARGKLEDREMRFQTVAWEGGKSLGTISRTSYLTIARKYGLEAVKTGELALLSGPLAQDIQLASWRKAHHIV